MMSTCPFCGGTVSEYELTNMGGTIRASGCCDVSMDLIENYDVFEALPAMLQQAALEKDRTEQAAVFVKNALNSIGFVESRDRWLRTHAHLFKGEHEVTPHDRPRRAQEHISDASATMELFDY